MPVPGGLHGVQGAEDGQGEGCVGQSVLAAPHHVHAVADPVGIALRQLADQRRRARALHVGLVDAPAHAALQARGAGGLQERLGPVALQAQGLQHLGLALQGLVHGDDVVELAAAQLDEASQNRAPGSSGGAYGGTPPCAQTGDRSGAAGRTPTARARPAPAA